MDLASALSRIEGKIDITQRKIDITQRTTFEFALRSFDAYGNMTQTSGGNKKPLQEKIRKDYFEFCGICNTNDPHDESKTLACCVLTGRTGEGRQKTLKLAHLVPASTSRDILRTIRLSNDENGVWSTVIELEY